MEPSSPPGTVGAPTPARPRGGLPPWLKGVIVLAAPIFLLAALVMFNVKKEAHSVQEGDIAPDFTLVDLEGRTHKLSDYRGKTVLINFWATWCRSCIQEFPALERMYAVFASDNFVVMAVNLDAAGKSVVEPFIKRYPMNFTVLLDQENRLTEAYGTTGVPETFLIDKNGIVVKKYIGPFEWDQPWFAKELKPLLN